MGLLASLDRGMFKITSDHYLRVERLLDRIGPQSRAEKLRSVIAPIVVTSAEQQKRFDKAFAEYLARAVFVEDTPSPPDSSDRRRRTSVRVSASHDLDAPPPHFPRFARWFIGGSILALTVVGVWRNVHKPHPTSPKGDSAIFGPPPPTTGFDTLTTSGREPELLLAAPFDTLAPQWYIRYANLVRGAGVAIPLLVAAGVEWARWRRRKMIAERAASAGPPISLQFTVPKPTLGPFGQEEIRRTARDTRRRQRSAVMNLSIPHSVSATVEALGLPTLVFAPATRPPEYVVLIEHASAWDHQARYYEALIDLLDAEGAIVNRYRFDTDPRLCFPKDRTTGVWLGELQHLHPDARLIVIGSGSSFLDPFTGLPAEWFEMLHGWDERAFLTTIVPREWGRRELLLAREMVVLPATHEGIRATTDYFDSQTKPNLREWRRRLDAIPPPDATLPVGVSELRGYFSNEAGFRWLCACATYTELRWDLTLYLATIPSLRAAALSEDNLLRLVSLPWFRSGVLPDALKLGLLDALTEIRRAEGIDIEGEARAAVNTILVEGTSAEPSTVADERRQQARLTNDLYLHRHDRKKVREILAELRGHVPVRQLRRDVTIVRLVSQLGVSRLAYLLPESMRRLLFVDGKVAFGPRWTATAIAGLVVASWTFLAAPRREPLIPLAELEIEPQAVFVLDPTLRVSFTVRGSRPESTLHTPVVVEWKNGGVATHVDTISAGDAAFESRASIERTERVLTVDRAGLGGAGVNRIEANVGRSWAKSKLLFPPADTAPSSSAQRQHLLRPRLIQLGVPYSFAATLGRVGIDTTTSTWSACGDGLRVTRNGRVTALDPGWGIIRTNDTSGAAFIPVYAASHRLSLAERQLVAPLLTDDAEERRLGLDMKARALALNRAPRIEVFAWYTGVQADSEMTLATRVGRELVARGAPAGRVSARPSGLGSCLRDMPSPLSAELQLAMFFALASDSATTPNRIPAGLLASDYSGTWTSNDSADFAFKLRIRVVSDTLATATFNWTLVNAGPISTMRSHVGDTASETGRATFNPRTLWVDIDQTSVSDTTFLGRDQYRLQFDSTLTRFTGRSLSNSRNWSGRMVGGVGLLGDWTAERACAALRPDRRRITLPREGGTPMSRRSASSLVPLAPWSSADNGIAAIGNTGMVSALSPGTTKLFFLCGQFADTVDVTVTDTFVPADTTALRSLPNTVYFEYDRTVITPTAARILDAWLNQLLTNLSIRIRVAGYTDERGNDEYNLALGQRLGDAVRRYFVERGVAVARIEVLSYGEERPVCQEHTEQCWARNRRADIEVISGFSNQQRKP